MLVSFRFVTRFLFTLALLATSSMVAAGAPEPYDQAAFKAAQAAGKSIIVEIHADWCTECKVQNTVLNKLSDQPAYAGLVRLRVDYDRQKDIVKEFKARHQSTLIVYRGDKELGRAVGITSEEQIRALVEKVL